MMMCNITEMLLPAYCYPFAFTIGILLMPGILQSEKLKKPSAHIFWMTKREREAYKQGTYKHKLQQIQTIVLSIAVGFNYKPKASACKI